jgi:NAD(P)H-flavin reductase
MFLPAPSNTCVVTCGPEVMMRYVAESAIGRGIPISQIWLSLERHMQCAAGFCGHCQLGPAFVCKDGPVFRYDVMRPFLLVESL